MSRLRTRMERKRKTSVSTMNGIGCHQQRYLNIRIRVIPTPVVLLSARPLPLTSTCQKCPRIAFMNWGLIVMGVEIDVFLKLFSLTANRGLLNCSNSSYDFSSCQKEQAAGTIRPHTRNRDHENTYQIFLTNQNLRNSTGFSGERIRTLF